MSTTNTAAIQNALYDSEVKHYYAETENILRKACTFRGGVEGKTYNFRTMGKILATERTSPSQDVVPQNPAQALVPCTLKDYDVSVFIDAFANRKINFDERREAAFEAAGAINRKFDQIILDALVAAVGSPLTTIDENIGGTDSNLNMTKLLAAKAAADAADWPKQDRWIVCHSNAINYGLLTDPTITNVDYTTLRALDKGDVGSFLGFNFITIGDRDEGGIALGAVATGERRAFAFHRRSLGLAVNIEITSRMEWIPIKKSWMCTSEFSSASVVIDNRGLIVLDTQDAADYNGA